MKMDLESFLRSRLGALHDPSRMPTKLRDAWERWWDAWAIEFMAACAMIFIFAVIIMAGMAVW